MRSGPFWNSTVNWSISVFSPPMPEPMITPARSANDGSMVKRA